MATHVYVSNMINQDVHVLPVEKLDWMIQDLGFSMVSFTEVLAELRAITMVAQLPATLKTVEDLYNFLRIVAMLGRSVFGAEGGAQAAAVRVIDQFKVNSIKVPAGQVVDVLELSSFSNYTLPSGIHSMLFGAETFNLLVMADDGSRVALGSTNSDHSWIVQDDRLVRAAYGTTHQPDPDAGVILFNVGGFVPSGSYQRTCKDIKVTLTCNARTRDGSTRAARFDLTALSGDTSLSNVDGSLVADHDTASADGFVPGGSYRQSCSSIKVVLTCQAKKADGSYQAASLDITRLHSADVANNNGVLVNED